MRHEEKEKYTSFTFKIDGSEPRTVIISAKTIITPAPKEGKQSHDTRIEVEGSIEDLVEMLATIFQLVAAQTGSDLVDLTTRVIMHAVHNPILEENE